MNNKTTFKQGFTLIELLVVVAIIGLLTSVVLVSLTTGKNRGADASVKSNLSTVRAQSEIFYLDNVNSYLPPTVGTTFGPATCPTYNPAGTNMFSRNKVMADAIAEAVFRGGSGSFCYNSANSWAVAVGLKEELNTSWCVDNAGSAKKVALSPDQAINASTFLCN